MRTNVVAIAMAVLSVSAHAEIQIVKKSSYLQPDEAFKAEVNVVGNQVLLDVSIEEGYQLYRDKFSLIPKTEGVEVMFDSFPSPSMKNYKEIGETLAVYDGDFEVGLFSTANSGDKVDFTLKYQGCAESGLCYPPQSKDMSFVVP